MENGAQSFGQTLWQVTGVMGLYSLIGLGVAAIIMVIRYVWLVRKDRNAADTEKSASPDAAPTLGEKLRSQRLRCHMTQEFVAESLGVSRQAVSKWESGASEPSTANLLALAKLFNVDAGELLKSI